MEKISKNEWDELHKNTRRVFVNILGGNLPTEESDRVVLKNCRSFFEKYGVWSRCTELFGPYGRPWDMAHPWFFRDTFGGILLVVSNYGAVPPPHYCMEEIPPVYNTMARSFVAHWPDRKTASRQLKGIRFINEYLHKKEKGGDR